MASYGAPFSAWSSNHHALARGRSACRLKYPPPKKTHALCWLNGEITTAAHAAISVLDHGLLYGDGVFEGLRFYNRRVFKLAEHLRRLRYSAQALGLSIPLDDIELSNAIAKLVAAFAADDGYLRLVVTRGVGPLGLDPSRCSTPTVFYSGR